MRKNLKTLPCLQAAVIMIMRKQRLGIIASRMKHTISHEVNLDQAEKNSVIKIMHSKQD
jgi:hypothetical protein